MMNGYQSTHAKSKHMWRVAHHIAYMKVKYGAEAALLDLMSKLPTLYLANHCQLPLASLYADAISPSFLCTLDVMALAPAGQLFL